MTLVELGIGVAGGLVSLAVAVVAARLDAAGRRRAGQRVFRFFGPLVGATLLLVAGVSRGWSAWQLAAAIAAGAVGALIGTLIGARGTRHRRG